MKALYDVGRFIVSFNFFEWLLIAQANGATEVVIRNHNVKTDKWPLAIAKERVDSIVKPGAALAGLPSSVGEFGDPNLARPGGGELVRFWKSGRRFKRLRSPRPAKQERYTVTLRNTQRSPVRNSKDEDWREFAAAIGAYVIEDYDVKPIHLHERMALYAGAEMNFFVSNGPAILCSFTEYPCMIFDCNLAEGSLKHDGIDAGAPYPWMVKNQFSIWELATLTSLQHYFAEWKSGRLQQAAKA